MAKNPFFFDLEAGGLSGHQSSILSISFGNNPKNVQSIYAEPTSGSRVYQWSERNVWNPIQKVVKSGRGEIGTERTALNSFLGALRQQRTGTTLAGWNIGYEPSMQEANQARMRGYDIPMLLTRAEKYGMRKAFESELGRFKIRDIGQEYAWKVASEARAHPNLIEKDFFRQIETYSRVGESYRTSVGGNISERTIARYTSMSGYKMAGWAQELLYGIRYPGRSLQAHMSSEDVRAGLELTEDASKSLFGGDPIKVAAWHERALARKYASSIRSRNSPELIQEVFSKARSPISATGQALPSVEGALMKEISGLAEGFGMSEADILSGTPIKDIPKRYGAAKLGKDAWKTSEIVGHAVKFAKRHKGKLAIGAGAAALFVLEPLSWFTGSDDGYNTIEGLHHKGIAARKRREMTDFGSGYQGSENKGNINLYRGTHYKIDIHEPQKMFQSSPLAIQREGENYLELIRQKYFSNRPSRSLSTFWTPNPELAAIFSVDLQQGPSTTGGSVSRISRSAKETFFTRPSYYTDFMNVFASKNGPNELTETLAKKYWEGIELGAVSSADRDIETLLQGNIKSGKEWMVSGSISDPSVFAGKGELPRFKWRKYKSKIIDDFTSSYTGKTTTGISSKKGLFIGMAYGAVAAGFLYSWFSGKDDAYNTIEGLSHKGMAGQRRGVNTDFGSGYQGLKEESNRTFEYMAAGAGGAALGYGLAYPWAYKNINAAAYPRLASLRKAGQKGFAMVAEGMSSESIESWGGKMLWGELGTKNRLSKLRDFEGVVYLQSGEWAESQRLRIPKMANWGNWDIGSDKLKTYQFLQAKKQEALHVKTLAASDLYREGKLSETGKQFIKEAGGLENIVVKRNVAARGMGVWMNGATLPSNIAEEMYKNPQEFLLQHKMDLAEEFRVVTVGDKPVHTTYRFGSPRIRKLAKDMGYAPMKEVINKSKLQKSPFEVIQPVLDRDLRGRLEAFATKASKELPYEIGALDIAMTKSGEFKIIEAQRSFGNISNPIVSRRIRNIITGKPGMMGVVAGVIGGGLALMGANILFGNDDAHNTIEGLRHEGIAGQMRKVKTDFGSGWRGILAVPKLLRGAFTEAGFAALSISKENLPGLLKRDIAPILAKKGISVEERNILNKTMQEFAEEAQKSGYKDVVLVNPQAIRAQASAKGVSYSRELKGTIRHERFHQALTESGERSSLLANVKVEKKFSKDILKAYRKKGLSLSDEALKEEYLAHGVTESFHPGKQRMFNQAQTQLAKIEDRLNRSFVRKQIAFQKAHRRGVMRALQNALNAGRRYMKKAGSIVQ